MCRVTSQCSYNANDDVVAASGVDIIITAARQDHVVSVVGMNIIVPIAGLVLLGAVIIDALIRRRRW